MLVHRLRRWTNIKTALVERFVFDGWPCVDLMWVNQKWAGGDVILILLFGDPIITSYCEPHIALNSLQCKAKRQYLLNCKISRYCHSALQSSIGVLHRALPFPLSTCW